MVPVLLPCPLHRRSPSFSASGSAPFGTGTQCSSRFIGARPWLTRALLPAASGSLFCSVPLGAPMYRSCQGRGRDAEDGSWDAPPRAREFPRASSLEMGAFRNSVGSRGTPSFSCKPDLSLCDLRLRLQVGCSFEAVPPVAPDCVIRRRGGEVPVGHELQAVRDAGLHYGLDKVAGLVRGELLAFYQRDCAPRLIADVLPLTIPVQVCSQLRDAEELAGHVGLGL
eukprot:tig00000101_g4451.t3